MNTIYKMSDMHIFCDDKIIYAYTSNKKQQLGIMIIIILVQ